MTPSLFGLVLYELSLSSTGQQRLIYGLIRKQNTEAGGTREGKQLIWGPNSALKTVSLQAMDIGDNNVLHINMSFMSVSSE